MLVCVSDLHCGSTVGLCPPRCPLLDDGYWELNAIQEWLWKSWQDFQARVRKATAGRRFALLVNGDAIEGVHHHTKQIVHADPGVHARIAVECLRPLAKLAAAVYVVQGTGAHVGHASEMGIGEALGSVQHPHTKMHAAQHWRFRVGNVLVSAKHHIGPTSRRALRGSQLSINMEEELAESSAAGHERPTLLIRSHRHVYGAYSDESAMIVVTPAWQSLTSHGWKVVPNAIPRVGGVILDMKQPGLPALCPIVYTPQQTEVHRAQ